MRNVAIVIGVLFVLVLCIGCGILGVVQSAQVSLLGKQQTVLNTNAQFEGAKDIVAQKIFAAFDLADRQISHEDRTYKVLADARKQFDEAVKSGVQPDIVTAAQGFHLQFRALAESNPQFASGPVVTQAINAMEEAVNEIFTKFQDTQTAVRDYNTYRNSLFAPAVVGSMLNFPPSYEYYKGSGKPFDIKQQIPPTPKAP